MDINVPIAIKQKLQKYSNLDINVRIAIKQNFKFGAL